MRHLELSPLFRAQPAGRDIRYRSPHVHRNYTLLHTRANRLGALNPAMTEQPGVRP